MAEEELDKGKHPKYREDLQRYMYIVGAEVVSVLVLLLVVYFSLIHNLWD